MCDCVCLHVGLCVCECVCACVYVCARARAHTHTIGTLGYQHLTVNHSLNFVDPTTGACTNHIESVWQKAKQKHKQRYGTHRELLHTCLAEFMWRQRFGCSFHDFVAHDRAFYPV